MFTTPARMTCIDFEERARSHRLFISISSRTSGADFANQNSFFIIIIIRARCIRSISNNSINLLSPIPTIILSIIVFNSSPVFLSLSLRFFFPFSLVYLFTYLYPRKNRKLNFLLELARANFSTKRVNFSRNIGGNMYDAEKKRGDNKLPWNIPRLSSNRIFEIIDWRKLSNRPILYPSLLARSFRLC